MSKDFVHLHTHSEYSLLDGASRVETLVKRAVELGMPALALSDHGVMYGAIDFYRSARDHGIRPIIGCELYVAPRSRFDKSSRKEDYANHLLLLAKDEEGYKNLMHLVTLSYFEGFYYKPRVDKEILGKRRGGLIALSACLTGEIPKLLMAGEKDKAKAVAGEYAEMFGKDGFFLELQNQQLEDQPKVNEGLAEIAADLKVPLVATNDIHYANQADNTAHDALLCIQTGSVIAEKKRLRFGSDQFYMKSQDEMATALPEWPEALANTARVAEQCNLEIDFGRVHLPQYQVPDGYSLHSYLEELCHEGVKDRYDPATQDVLDRVDYELKIIEETGFSAYFLVVWDFVRFAREKGIKVGPGRGSAAGSMVSYALGITNVDPIEHNLFFERFLNPERVTMPDIDIDFDDERRDEVINYVIEKYGEDRVAQIITFGTMKARAAIRDAGRVFDVPYGKVDRIAKLVPPGPGVTMEAALKDSVELQAEYRNDETARAVIDAAKSLEGLARHDSTHAAGVVIARDELTNYTPLQRKDVKEVVTQFPMEAIEKIGLLKIDFLGLRTLTVIANAAKIIKRTHGTELDIDKVGFEDEKTYKLLQAGDTIGVFQLESSGMRSLLKDMQPTKFEDIINVLALYRPGPLDSGMVKDFVDRKRGRKKTTFVHPSLEPILSGTYGAIVYQEQVMQIASEMAGFSMGEADILRKAMSKPNPKVFTETRERFVEGAAANGVQADKANQVFDLIVHFAGYGFNRAHSCGYAVIAYQTAYLKAHYPAEFMAALLTSVMGNKDKVAQQVAEARRLGFEVLPPDVNESLRGFTVVSGSDPSKGQIASLRFGLAVVQNVGEGAITSIIQSRKEKGPFKSVYDFAQRVDLKSINKRAFESLIKAGAFDSTGLPRKYLLTVYDGAVDAGLKRQRDLTSGQSSFFGDEETHEPAPPPSPEEFSKEHLLAQEKEMLGLYVTDHPLLGFEELLRSKVNMSLAELADERDGTVLWVAGLVSKVSATTTRKGDRMGFLTIEDLEGSAEVIVFPKVFDRNIKIIKEDAILRIKGRLDVKEDETKIIAQEIQELREDGKPTKGPTAPKRPAGRRAKAPEESSLAVNFRLDDLEPGCLERVRDILKRYPGPAPVSLNFAGPEKTTTYTLGPDFAIAPEAPLMAELKELLGEDALTFQ